MVLAKTFETGRSLGKIFPLWPTAISIPRGFTDD
jgi:hypothetical protein